MVKELWLNLPVKNVAKSIEFFEKIGFQRNMHQPATDDMASIIVGTKGIIVMLVREGMFEGFAQNKVFDTKTGNEMLISFDAESPAEVDEIAKNAEAAGGTIFGKPSSVQGWMYGCGFSDLDGHRWNVLHMDMSKLPQ